MSETSHDKELDIHDRGKGLKEVKDKFGITESVAREMHESMRLRFPEFPITKWEDLKKRRDYKQDVT